MIKYRGANTFALGLDIAAGKEMENWGKHLRRGKEKGGNFIINGV